MNTRRRNLAVAGFVAVLLVMTIQRTTQPTRTGAAPAPSAPTAAVPPTAAPSPASWAQPGATEGEERVGHAIEVARLEGLPPDAAPGDVFDIWVAWGPPIANRPNIQRLVKAVTLERIATPVTPDGPYVAVLSVTRRDATDLLYGTRYGVLSVTQPAEPARS